MDKERPQFLDTKDSAAAAIIDSYPFVPEGSQLSFTNGLGGMFAAINEQGIKLSADKPPRLRQVVFDSQGQLLKSNIIITYGDEELRIRNGEEAIFKSGDYYALRLIELSHEQQEVLKQKHGEKGRIVAALLVRGKMEAEEKYQDLTYLIYESDLSVEKAELQTQLEVLLNQQFSKQESSWVVRKEELGLLDMILQESGVRVEPEETISEQYKGLFKKLSGMYQPKLLRVNGYGDKLFYPQTDGTLVLGESVVNTKGREDFLAYEQQLVEAKQQAQQNVGGIAFLPTRRFTKGGGQLSGVTLKETEDIVEKTAVDKDGNVVTAFMMAEPGKIFNELQVGEIEKLLVAMIQAKMGESKERILINGPLVFAGLPGVMGWGDWKGIEVNGARRIDEIWTRVINHENQNHPAPPLLAMDLPVKVMDITLGSDFEIPTRLDLEGIKDKPVIIFETPVVKPEEKFKLLVINSKPKQQRFPEAALKKTYTLLDDRTEKYQGLKPTRLDLEGTSQTVDLEESKPVIMSEIPTGTVLVRGEFAEKEEFELRPARSLLAGKQEKATAVDEEMPARTVLAGKETELMVKKVDRVVIYQVPKRRGKVLVEKPIQSKIEIPIYQPRWQAAAIKDIPEWIWQGTAADLDEIIDWPWFLATMLYALLNTKVLLKEKIS